MGNHIDHGTIMRIAALYVVLNGEQYLPFFSANNDVDRSLFHSRFTAWVTLVNVDVARSRCDILSELELSPNARGFPLSWPPPQVIYWGYVIC